MRKTPLISVIIPCYNEGDLLWEAVHSVPLREDTEIIIVNDHTTDEKTLDVLRELKNQDYLVIDSPGLGVGGARNLGISKAKGTYVLMLDADNKLLPVYIPHVLTAIQKNPVAGIIYGDWELFGNKTGIVKPGPLDLNRLMTGNYIDAGMVIKKSCWETLGGFDAQIPHRFYEDWEFYLHAAFKGELFHYIPETLYQYRVRSGSLVSKASNPEWRREAVYYIIHKHAVHYHDKIADPIANLHAALADWEQQFSLKTAAVETEFLQHRKVAEQAFEDEKQKLETHYFTERKKVETHYFEEKKKIEAVIEGETLKNKHNITTAYEAKEKKITEHYRQELQEKEKETLLEKIRLEEAYMLKQQELEGLLEEKIKTLQINFLEKEILLNQALDASRHNLHILYEEERNTIHRQTQEIVQALDLQRKYSAQLDVMAQHYEVRLKEMENTRTWRLRKNYYKMRNIFRSHKSGKRRKLPGLGFIKKAVFFFSRKGRLIIRRFFKKIFRTLYIWLEEFPVRIVPASETVSYGGQDVYHQWMAKNFPREIEFKTYKKEAENFDYKPLISVLLPVYNPPVDFFRATLNSVLVQLYENWELCIADDCSTNPAIHEILEEYKKKDFRIKVVYRQENGHISRASNSALELVTGEFTLLLDHDDLLTQDCMYHVVKFLNEDPGKDLIYSDEDKIDEKGRHNMPHFKPHWCPDNFTSRNYLGHVVVVRSSILKAIGGFRVGFEGSQDYDMLLRFMERSRNIGHLPRVLYHWRIHAASAAGSEEAKPYAYEAARKALTESLARQGEPADVDFLAGYRGYSIHYHLQKPGKISVLIPTKDNADVIQTCIDSIFGKSTWQDFEVIVVSNNSTEKKLFALLDHYQQIYKGRFHWYEHNIPFNFSALMNDGFSKATGDYFLLLNNDTEVITPGWMEGMMAQAQRKSVGAVGVKLLYPNDTIQHAGVIIGLGGVAGHAFTAVHRDAAGYFNFIQSINNYSAVTAACLMVSREKYEAVQGFDEKFEVEYNDVDFCLKLMKKGWNNVYLPHVELYHHESLTRGHPHMSKESYERHIRELTLFKERWHTIIEDDPCYSIHLTRGAHDFAIAI